MCRSAGTPTLSTPRGLTIQTLAYLHEFCLHPFPYRSYSQGFRWETTAPNTVCDLDAVAVFFDDNVRHYVDRRGTGSPIFVSYCMVYMRHLLRSDQGVARLDNSRRYYRELSMQRPAVGWMTLNVIDAIDAVAAPLEISEASRAPF